MFNLFKKKKKPPVSCVYAGPEMMGRVYDGPKPKPKSEPDPAMMSGVYAGPDYFAAKNRQDDEEPDAPMEDVYNGPEFYEEISEEPEETPPPPEPIAPVYAGPEYFNPQQPPMAFVYAGPEYFNNTKPMNGFFAPGAFAPPPLDGDGEINEAARPDVEELDLDPDKVKCPSCGNVYFKESPFCPECGTPRPRNEGET